MTFCAMQNFYYHMTQTQQMDVVCASDVYFAEQRWFEPPLTAINVRIYEHPSETITLRENNAALHTRGCNCSLLAHGFQSVTLLAIY